MSASMPYPSLPLLSSRRQVLTAGFLAACGSVAALELLGSASADASATPATAGRVSVIGDSLTIGTLPYQSDALTAVGWAHSTVDAYGSRGVRTKLRKDQHTGLTSVDSIRTQSGDSHLWVIALGTNDAGIYAKTKHAEIIEMMMDRIGHGRKVMWVNVYLPETPPRQANWNAALAVVAEAWGHEMTIFDWASLAAANPRWVANDKIHCSAKGYSQRATAIAEATRPFLRVEPSPIRACWPWSKWLPA